MDLTCWLGSANEPETDFPIHNLPYGVFSHRELEHIGLAIGDRILDLHSCATNGLLDGLPSGVAAACQREVLNPLMQLGQEAWHSLRMRATNLLTKESLRVKVETHLVPMREVRMLLPARIGDYTDFYASLHHATRVGRLFRPDNPLLPNYKYVPIGYHGRASSLVVSGTAIQRPHGQNKQPSAVEPTFSASRSLDYELEIGAFIGPGNNLGEPIEIANAERHIFGLCLLNDWSARDIQAWEYQPLGPFLAKSFATSVSPWVVTMEALAPYRISPEPRAVADPVPLPYLRPSSDQRDAFDIALEVYIDSKQMRDAHIPPERVSHGNLRDLYWTLSQLLTHHASNGCNLRTGDLFATGTISGREEGSEGCLLEMKHRAAPLRLPSGETRVFLQDGDRVILRGFTSAHGLPRIGLGQCVGTVLASN